MLGGRVCFYPSPESAARLPRAPGDMRLAWFCLRNSVRAKALLGTGAAVGKACGANGQARISVDEYRAYSGEGDGFDTARLRAVPWRADPQPIPCD